MYVSASLINLGGKNKCTLYIHEHVHEKIYMYVYMYQTTRVLSKECLTKRIIESKFGQYMDMHVHCFIGWSPRQINCTLQCRATTKAFSCTEFGGQEPSSYTCCQNNCQYSG